MCGRLRFCAVYNRCMEHVKIEQHSSIGLLWIGGWLFTIGYLQLAFMKGALALIIWPYYLGNALQALMH